MRPSPAQEKPRHPTDLVRTLSLGAGESISGTLLVLAGCTPIDAARPPSGMSPVSDTVAVDTRVGIAAPATPRCTGRRSTPTARHWRGRGLCGSQPSEADRPPPRLVLIVH